MSIGLKARAASVAEVLSDAFDLAVPVFQRSYSWEEEHAVQLLDDLFAVLTDAGLNLGKANDYFLGAILLLTSQNETQADIIDGQQRLVTLTLLLALLRDALPADLRAPLNAALWRAAGRPRLLVRAVDRDFFRVCVLEPGGTALLEEASAPSEATERMRRNALAMRAEIAQTRTETLASFAEIILRKCFFVVTTTPAREQVFQIFHAMNDRGLKLSPIDLIRGRLVYSDNAAAGEQEKWAQRWAIMESAFGKEDLEGFVRLVLQIVLGEARVSDIEEAFERILHEPKLLASFETDFPKYFEAYQQIIDCDLEAGQYSHQVNEMLSVMHRLPIKDWHVPVLLVAVRHRFQPALIRDFLARVELFIFAALVLGFPKTRRAKRLAELTRFVVAGGDALSLDTTINLTQAEREALKAALRGDIYTRGADVARAVLLKLETLISENKTAPALNIEPTVEHVLPQNPALNSPWLKEFNSVQQRKTLTHRLGNLVLLSGVKNQRAGNWPFERKKKEYFARNGVSTFATTVSVLREPRWTAETIKRRTQNLVEALERAWDL